MVFVHNAPPTINLSEPHSQSKFQLLAFAVRTDAGALLNRRGESHVFACSNPHVVKVKGDRLLDHDKKNFSHVAV
jgi:hypothetical protein